ncbi:hypothetical protein [Janthinobacterium agaricidamnosum]|uniref:Uncharacterized protein n=1 Tax=Janthinobacterium agaricidamnosum NBRC 102515 = DSM 9628 TaxID=1349767 RepID=W0VDF1_9BURK|nr:hypothetical protein [Janthinobacterium agaricidamnosum]CDG85690.1 hypothetical protein GJA_5092 [Janthinobacterium agaricidamnosum NBRC 102515 = DSM 9628]
MFRLNGSALPARWSPLILESIDHARQAAVEKQNSYLLDGVDTLSVKKEA